MFIDSYTLLVSLVVHICISFSYIMHLSVTNTNTKAPPIIPGRGKRNTSRSKSPKTPSTSPAAPTKPRDSPNKKAASTATVNGWESIITCNQGVDIENVNDVDIISTWCLNKCRNVERKVPNVCVCVCFENQDNL